MYDHTFRLPGLVPDLGQTGINTTRIIAAAASRGAVV